MNKWKGFFNGVKKGSLGAVTEANVFVVDEPVEPFIETDPTVPSHVKEITVQDLLDFKIAFDKNLVSGSITGDINKVLTLTHRDGNIITIPFTDLQGQTTDDVINTFNFNPSTGAVTVVTSEGVQLTENFDGRYELLFAKNTAFNKNFGGNGAASTVSRSDHTHNYESPITFQNGNLISVIRTGNSIKIDKTTKIPYPMGSNIGFGFSSSFNTRWIVAGEGATSNGNLNIGAGNIGDEVEGVWLGSGRFTVQGSGGLTLIYADEFFTNTYPTGGVFGIKQLTATTAVLFGKQIPIGL